MPGVAGCHKSSGCCSPLLNWPYVVVHGASPVWRSPCLRVGVPPSMPNPADDGDVVFGATPVQDRAPVHRPTAEHNRRAKWKEILRWSGCSTVGSPDGVGHCTWHGAFKPDRDFHVLPGVTVLVAALRIRRHSTAGGGGYTHWARRWMPRSERLGRSASLRELDQEAHPTGGFWTEEVNQAFFGTFKTIRVRGQ
jgi:hypothetical protein